MTRKEFVFSGISGITGALFISFICYCEKIQLAPYSAKGSMVRLAAAALAGGIFFALLFFLVRKSIRLISKKEWFPVILIAMTASVCMMVWFPVPDTGLYPEHELLIRNLPDENGDVRPVTLTWLHPADRDIPLTAVHCSGDCISEKSGITLSGENAELTWHGMTGDTITIEFVSGEDQGIAEIRWDGEEQIRALNNSDLNRLSFDFCFSPANGFPEFIAVWWLCFLLCLAGTVTALKALPAWNIRSFGIGAFVCFAVFRVIQFSTVREPLFFIDSESYLGMSRMSTAQILRGAQYCHEQFWYCIARPAFIPLVYKICRQDPKIITAVQLTVSILSWGYFALQAQKLCRTRSRKKAVLILIFGLGCVPNGTRWDQIIMSESLSISAALLMMGSCFRLMLTDKDERWKPVPAICTGLSALLYAQSRDSAVWTVILMIILLLCLNRLRKQRIVIFLLCAFLAAVCWSVMGNTGGRWQYPFENVLFSRILRDPQGEQFFIEAGMPTPPRIKELYGVEHMMGSELFNSEEMAPLREWILTDGLKTYIRYMLHIPFRTLTMAWRAGFEREAFEQIGYTFTPSGFSDLIPDPVLKFFSCNLPGILIIGLGLTGLWYGFKSPYGERYAFPVLFVLSAYILCSGVLIADEYEFARHSLVILLMMKASAWPLICMISEKQDQ